jgi:hypothetical protein
MRHVAFCHTEIEVAAQQEADAEWPNLRICDLLLGPPPGSARLADHLDEATGQLGIEVAAQQEADAEMEALWTSAA